MPSLAEVLSQKVDRLIRRIDSSSGLFEVVTVSPFTVYLNGDESTAVPGIPITGLSYSVGTTGRYWLDQGGQPWCWPGG